MFLEEKYTNFKKKYVIKWILFRLILPGELRKHAIMEGEKAVKKYDKNYKNLKKARDDERGGKKGHFPGRRKE